MRIAYFGSRHPASNYGGVERVLSHMLPRLAARGHEITVYSAPTPGETPGRSTWNGVKVVALSCIRGKHTETISRTAASVAHAVSHRFDVAHFTHQGPGVFTPVTRLFGIPSVVSVEGLDWSRAKWNRFASTAIKGAERLAVQHASSIVVVSKALQGYFRETYGRETDYIPHGLIHKAVPEDTSELSRLGLEPDRYVLFAARLVPEKAVHELIAAWNEIDTDMKLVVAGGGRYDSGYVAALHDLADRNKVIFTGHVQGQTLAELFGHCYLFVLPSHIEGQSLALLEALGYGRAVLVSSIAESTEVVGENGFVFPVGDVAALKRTLQQIVSSRNLVAGMRTKIRSGRSCFPSWDDAASMQEDLYRSLVQHGRRRVPGRVSPQAVGEAD